MTNEQLDTNLAETMATLRSDGLVDAIKKAYKGYADDLKEEARKHKKKGETLAQAIERLSEDGPGEVRCYIMFNNDAGLRGWVIEHNQYWQGNSGPSSSISLSPDPTYKEIESEIGNDLAEAFEIED